MIVLASDFKKQKKAPRLGGAFYLYRLRCLFHSGEVAYY